MKKENKTGRSFKFKMTATVESLDVIVELKNELLMVGHEIEVYCTQKGEIFNFYKILYDDDNALFLSGGIVYNMIQYVTQQERLAQSVR
jgi:hypothetical protein